MIKHGFALIFIASISAMATSSDSQWTSNWKDYDPEDGVQIACKTHRSNIDICRYTTLTDLSVDALVAVNIDIPNLSIWMENIITSEFVDRNSAFDYQVYSTYNFPGARNRDSLTHSKVTIDQATGAATLAFQSTTNDKKPNDISFVRFPLIKGAWKFIPQANGQTQVQYSTLALPGAYVQEYLSDIYNYTSRGAGAKTVQNLLDIAQQPQYQRFEISSVTK